MHWQLWRSCRKNWWKYIFLKWTVHEASHPTPSHPLDENVTTHVHLSHIQRWLSCLWYCMGNLFIIHFKVSKNPFKKQTSKTNRPKPKPNQNQKHHKKNTKHVYKWQLVICTCRRSATRAGTASSVSSMLPLVNPLNILGDDFEIILAILVSPPEFVKISTP